MKSIILVCALMLGSNVLAAGVSLQVLGSGGPIADDERASSGYIIRIGGHGRVLIDTGGGVFQRFGAAGLKMEDLTFVGITHFHTDHSADFPALMKSAYFSDRTAPLYLAGPAAGGPFPGLHNWLDALFAKGKGAYGYLSGYLETEAEPFALNPIEIPSSTGQPFLLVNFEAYTVSALAVPHGPVPSLAYKIQIGENTIVISGDQNLSNPDFIEFLKNTDLWVMPMPIPEAAGPIARNLHAQPSKIGEVAAAAGVKRLLLSHFMARSLNQLEASLVLVKKTYKGQVTLAEDLIQLDL